MKHSLLLIIALLNIQLEATPNLLLRKPVALQAPPSAAGHDDEDGTVILANMANMLCGLATVSINPHDPAVFGPGIAQIGISFINILAQVFKSMPMRGQITRHDIECYFKNLSDEVKIKLITLLLTYADLYGNTPEHISLD